MSTTFLSLPSCDRHVLVTGGSGFIGSNITKYLLSLGWKVRVLDNLSTGRKSNLEPLLKQYPETLEFMYGDIANLETCRKAVDGVDSICHQAALGSVPRSVGDPLSSFMSNVLGQFQILLAAKEAGIKRVVYASSSSVYGDSPILPKVEPDVGTPLSPYAVTKKSNELWGKDFSLVYGMECIGLRYFNVFGPNQDPKGAYAAVIPKFIDLVRDEQVPTINGDGTYSRDFTYVTNVVRANYLALTTDNEECFGEVFNIGAGGRITIGELYKTIANKLEFDREPNYGPLRAGDIPHSNASVEKAQKLLGYEPLVSFKEGIGLTIDHYLGKKKE